MDYHEGYINNFFTVESCYTELWYPDLLLLSGTELLTPHHKNLQIRLYSQLLDVKNKMINPQEFIIADIYCNDCSSTTMPHQSTKCVF